MKHKQSHCACSCVAVCCVHVCVLSCVKIGHFAHFLLCRFSGIAGGACFQSCDYCVIVM